ncbi:hypothetical protein ACFOW1_15220 [Parasediminibacterium paludis]|uniref:Uncharacterized protein n=1 Tax=Parasediminibacterium paludis TaxID=908966 RepID=A0ABV8Q1X9_9BACT
MLQLDNSNNVVIQNNSSSQPYFVLYTLNGAQKTTVINPSTTFQLGTAIPTFTNAGVKSSMAYPTNASILNQLPSAAYNASDATLSALYISPATSPSTKYSVSPAFSPSITSYTVTIPKTTGPFMCLRNLLRLLVYKC